MIDKKELLLNTNNNLNHSEDYLALWTQIAKKFIFHRHSFDTRESKPLEENIIKETNLRYIKNYSSISTKPDYKIIWNASNEYLLINKIWEYSVHNLTQIC